MIMKKVFNSPEKFSFISFFYNSFILLDLRLAAELGRYLLEQNQDLQNYINVLQKQLDDNQYDMKVR
jgi:hypothetical protein